MHAPPTATPARLPHHLLLLARKRPPKLIQTILHIREVIMALLRTGLQASLRQQAADIETNKQGNENASRNGCAAEHALAGRQIADAPRIVESPLRRSGSCEPPLCPHPPSLITPLYLLRWSTHCQTDLLRRSTLPA